MAAGHKGGKPSSDEMGAFRRDLLAWYDRHRRALPWRAKAGIKPDPYHVWLSEIMLQQTVVVTVIPYFQKFVENWPTVQDLAAAPLDEVTQAWAGLGYYARARNLHKCAQVIMKEHNGRFPRDTETLKTLPGIGDYTSGAIAAIAFDRPASAMDGNVERVLARYYCVTTPLPEAKKPLRRLVDDLTAGRTDRPGDFAQALMDLGATVCIPKAPRCGVCPLREGCQARQKGNAAALPRRLPKLAKPKRQGHFYWIVSDRGRVLLERRPEKGLLGGMIGLPTSEWVALKPGHSPLIAGLKQEIQENRGWLVTHTFTHFDLRLRGCVMEGLKENRIKESGYFWAEPEKLSTLGMPSVFRKAVKMMIKNHA